MKIKRHFAFGVIVLAAGALTLSGCTQAPSTSNNDKGGNETLAADVNDINAMDRSEVGDGGTLRLANNAFPANWNSFHSDGNEVNTSAIMNALYPALTVSDAKGEISANPEYTKRIEVVTEDPLVVEVELNEGMTWSDGTPIDYTSVANVFNTLNGSKADYGVASSEGYDKVEKVEEGDNELTARITFSEKYADWIGLLAVMPDSLVESADAFNSGWVDAPQVTAGPFMIDKIDAKNKTVLLKQDPNWWGTKPALAQVLFTTIEDPAATATAFQNGQLDAVETPVPAVYSVVQSMVGSGAELRKAAGPNWTHITLNGGEGSPLNDIALRQAIQVTLDRTELFESVNSTMPYPDDFEQLNNHILMTNQEGYKDNSGETAVADPEAGKKILEDAGYEFDADGNATKDGEKIELNYVYNDGSKTNEAVLPVVQEELKEIGVTVNEQKVPPTDLFAKYVIPGDFDMTLFGWAGTPYLSSGDAIWKQGGEQNFGQVGDDKLDDLVNQAAVEIDPATRLDLINEADAELWNLAGTIPLWQSYSFWVEDEDLANYGAFGFESPDWTKIGFVEGSDNLEG